MHGQISIRQPDPDPGRQVRLDPSAVCYRLPRRLHQVCSIFVIGCGRRNSPRAENGPRVRPSHVGAARDRKQTVSRPAPHLFVRKSRADCQDFAARLHTGADCCAQVPNTKESSESREEYYKGGELP